MAGPSEGRTCETDGGRPGWARARGGGDDDGVRSSSDGDRAASSASSAAARRPRRRRRHPGTYGAPVDPSLPNPTDVATDAPAPSTAAETVPVRAGAGAGPVPVPVPRWSSPTPAGSTAPAGVEVGAYLAGLAETGGTCTLTLTGAAGTATAQVTAEPDAASTSCPTLAVPGAAALAAARGAPWSATPRRPRGHVRPGRRGRPVTRSLARLLTLVALVASALVAARRRRRRADHRLGGRPQLLLARQHHLRRGLLRLAVHDAAAVQSFLQAKGANVRRRRACPA